MDVIDPREQPHKPNVATISGRRPVPPMAIVRLVSVGSTWKMGIFHLVSGLMRHATVDLRFDVEGEVWAWLLQKNFTWT